MANVDLSNQTGATPVEIPVPPVLASEPEQTKLPVAPCAPHSVSARTSLLLGDKVPEFSDIILPRLNIVQGVGALKDSYPQGAIVYGQSVTLYEPPGIDKKTGNVTRAGTKPLVLTVLGFRPTRYAEKIAGGARGLVVDTEEAVRFNGGTLDYKEWELKKAAGMKRFEPLVDAMVAIEKPADLDDHGTLFSFPAGGKQYAIALWGMKGTAYTAAAKRVFFTQRAMGCLRAGGYPSYSFAVTTRLEQYPGGNSAWIPIVVPHEKNTEAFLVFARNILEAPTQDSPETEVAV